MSTHKKQHSVIFMRAWLITIIGQCQVKALNTELTIAWFYKAVMRFMTSPNAPPSSLLIEFITQNDIHDHLEAGYSPGRVRQRLMAQIHFSHTTYCLQFWPSYTPLLSTSCASRRARGKFDRTKWPSSKRCRDDAVVSSADPVHRSLSEVNRSGADVQVVSCHRYLVVFHCFVEQLSVFHTSGLIFSKSSTSISIAMAS